MTKFFMAVFLVLSLGVSGCTFEQDVPGYGRADCIGLGETQNPNLNYETKGWNIFWGVLGTELFLIPPIIVVTQAWSCPVEVKPGSSYHQRLEKRRLSRPIN